MDILINENSKLREENKLLSLQADDQRTQIHELYKFFLWVKNIIKYFYLIFIDFLGWGLHAFKKRHLETFKYKKLIYYLLQARVFYYIVLGVCDFLGIT